MRARLPVLLVSVPITLAGLLAAHVLAYAWATGSGAHEHALLERTGHGYLPLAHTLVLAVGVGLVVAGLLLRARAGRGGPCRVVWAAFAPLLAFAVQEHLERLVHDGSLPAHLVLEPVFLIGLALQIPFGLLAVVLARGLLTLADRVGARIRTVCSVAVPSLPPAPCRPDPERPRTAPLARRGAGRAPPVPASR